MNQPINLVDLDFNNLKSNLVSYLKTTKVGQEFDLDSSDTSIDMINGLLTYNTLIWLHYIHVLNNESFISTAKNVESVSKLLQVIGFTPPTKKSAVSLVTFTKNNSSLAQVDTFAILKGKNIATNNSANFYYIGPRITLDSTSTLEFYAGKKLVNNIPIQVDLDNQEYQIPDKDIDIRTVLVSVDGTYWTNYTNIPILGTNVNSQIFFLVKKGDYYYIKFGKNLQSEDINSIGKDITSANVVIISYVISSGEAGNNVTFSSVTEFLSNGSLNIPSVSITSTQSSGGFDQPDINYLKYLGPRYYGYSSLVTSSDYEAVIASSGYVPNETDIENQIAVFDGQNFNSVYGKIYYSVIDLTASSSEISSLTTKLQDKSVVGLTVVYLESDDFVGNLTLNATYDSTKTSKSKIQLNAELKIGLENVYGMNKFNHDISKSNLVLFVLNRDPGLSINESSITITFDKVVDLDVSRNIRFYHAISSFTTTLVSTNLSGSNVKFKNTSTSVPGLSGYNYIGAYLSNDTAVNLKVGVYNPSTGHILFYDNVDPSDTFTLTITPNTNNIKPKNNMAVEYSVANITITDI